MTYLFCFKSIDRSECWFPVKICQVFACEEMHFNLPPSNKWGSVSRLVRTIKTIIIIGDWRNKCTSHVWSISCSHWEVERRVCGDWLQTGDSFLSPSLPHVQAHARARTRTHSSLTHHTVWICRFPLLGGSWSSQVIQFIWMFDVQLMFSHRLITDKNDRKCKLLLVCGRHTWLLYGFYN